MAICCKGFVEGVIFGGIGSPSSNTTSNTVNCPVGLRSLSASRVATDKVRCGTVLVTPNKQSNLHKIVGLL